MDFEDKKNIPATLRGYLESSGESIRILAWIWKSLQTDEQKFWIKRMSLFLFLNIVAQGLVPFSMSYIFNGLQKRSLSMIMWAIAATYVLMCLQKVFDYKKALYRERVLGLLQWILDTYITQRLFEKSLGQHAHHSSTLNVGNIDKGRWKLLELQSHLLYDGFQVIILLSVYFLLLWFVSPVSGAIMTIAIVVNMAWSLFLNHRVVLECTSIEKRFRKLNRWIVELWEKVERVKTSGKTSQMLDQMSGEFESITKDDIRFWHWFIGQNCGRDIVNTTAWMCVIGYGAWRAYAGEVMWGDLYPVYTWAGSVVMNIWQVSRIEHLINWNMPAIKSKLDTL